MVKGTLHTFKGTFFSHKISLLKTRVTFGRVSIKEARGAIQYSAEAAFHVKGRLKGALQGVTENALTYASIGLSITHPFYL